jgi:excisionase family DNA binding protein
MVFSIQMGAKMNLLTLKEVTKAMRVSESTVRRWVRDGSLPAYKIGKRGQLRVSKIDLDAFLERHRFKTNND